MATEALIGLIGLFGVLAGVFAERLIQRYGKLRCEISEFWLAGVKAPGHYMSVADT